MSQAPTNGISTSGKTSSARPRTAGPRAIREVVFVDGVRTPFGRAGEKGIYAGTRADDLVVKCIRELMRRNPSLPADRIDEVAIAATTQTGDQGLTIGRTAALLVLWAWLTCFSSLRHGCRIRACGRACLRQAGSERHHE